MGEDVAVFDMVNVSPKQRISHAHIRDDLITFHWHDPASEPEGAEGISLSREDWFKIMRSTYWKKEESIDPQGSERTNFVGAEVHVGYVVLMYKRGEKTADEEISVLSLRQVDGRLRRRHR